MFERPHVPAVEDCNVFNSNKQFVIQVYKSSDIRSTALHVVVMENREGTGKLEDKYFFLVEDPG